MSKQVLLGGSGNALQINVASSGSYLTPAGQIQQSNSASIGGTGVLGLSGISFSGGGGRKETGSGGLALAGISFNGAGARKETATANLALQGISFNSVGSITHIKGSGTLALRGISITAYGFDVGQPGGLRQFWTC